MKTFDDDSPPIKTSIDKFQNIFSFKIKLGYYDKISMPETMTLLGSTKIRITRDKKNVKMYLVWKLLKKY